MSKSKSPSPEHKLFTEFCENPRESDIGTIQGSHRFISLAIRGKVPKPKKSILTSLFQEFSEEPIKDWVFNRISKQMLLELALCILQDIISKGAARAKSLQLVVATTSDGEKTVVIEDGDQPEDAAAAQQPTPPTQILDATFRLADKNGKSPDVSISIGENKDPAYQPPDQQGYFTPSRSVRRNLQVELEVSHILYADLFIMA